MDILLRRHALYDDAETMDNTPRYDYAAQEWVTGHDHAHVKTDTSPLRFCGLGAEDCDDAVEAMETFERLGAL